MILDCFTYFNEREVLELRIRLLQDVVDQFVIIEADKTHTNLYKGYTLEQTIEELKLPKNKIKVVKIKLPDFDENADMHMDWWRERMQRNVLKEHIGENDIAIISDCDEIVDPQYVPKLLELARNNPKCVVRLPMIYCCYRADRRCYSRYHLDFPVAWTAGMICFKHHFEVETVSQIREVSFVLFGSLNDNTGRYKIDFDHVVVDTEWNLRSLTQSYVDSPFTIQHVGWHFSWMGDGERRLKKYHAYMHYMDNPDNLIDVGSGTKEDLENYILTVKGNIGDTHPVGKIDYVVREFDTEQLPKLLLDTPHLRQFFLPK